MSDLYNRIRIACENKGISIAEMCRRTGIGQGTISDIKHGRQASMGAEKIDKISSALGVSVAYLLGTEEKTNWEDAIEEHKKRLGNLTDVEYDEIIDAFTSASPELRAAALAVLKSGGHKS